MSEEIRVDTIEDGEKFAQAIVHQLVSVSHRGQFAMELAKALTVGGMKPVPYGLSPKYQAFTDLTPKEIVDRALAVANLLFDRMRAEKMAIDMPTVESLRRGRSGGIGFRGD